MARAGVIATDFLFNSPGGAEAMRYRTLPLGRKDRPGAVAAGRLKVPVDTHAAIALAVLFHEAREIERWESIALAFAGI